MKAIITLVIIAAIAFANQPSAHADDKTRALIGGVIGGIIIGKALDNHHGHVEVRHRSSRSYSNHRDNGYFKWVTVQVWVEGGYHYRYDDCGRRYKVRSRGRYVDQRQKVWVSHDRHYSHDRRYSSRDRHYSSRDRHYSSCDY